MLKKQLLLLVFSSMSFSLFSQQVTLNFKDTRLESIFSSINQQTGYTFSYSPQTINSNQKASINVSNIELNKALTMLFKNLNIVYEIIKPNKILLNSSSKNTATTLTIKGTVLDDLKTPLPGATIVEKGTNNAMITDFNGNFSMSVLNNNAVLVISSLGFATQEIPVLSNRTFNIALKSEVSSLDEVVVVGYGSQKKSSVTGSVSKITSAEIEQQVATSFDDAIAGQLAGVSISQNSGAPGTTSEINIRGIGTLTAGRNPLLVIDGFPSSESTDLTSINPNNIKSIEILKDASASAIYGSRGSNGVILITTKTGSKNKTEFYFNSYYGFQEVSKKIKLANAYQRANLVANSRNNSWMGLNVNNSSEDPNSIRPSDLQIPQTLFPYLEGVKGLTDTNWQDEIFRTAPISNYELAASGGSDKVTYFVSGNFHNREGIVINSDYKRYSFTGNLKAQLTKNLELGFNLTPTFTAANEINEGDHKDNGIIFTALVANPMYAPKDANGNYLISEMIADSNKYGFAPTENPVALAQLTSAEKKVTQILGTFYLNWELFDGLKLKTQFGGQSISARENVFKPSTLGSYNIQAPNQAFGSSETDDILNFSWENTLTYNKTYNNSHNIELLAGHSFQSESAEGNNLLANNFPNDQVKTLNAGQVISGSSYKEEWNLLSFFGRVNYNYQNKYLVSAALRADASSRFGKNNKWGTFPSLSLGWNIAKEDFFNLASVSELKLRASYGITGNNQISNFGSIALLNDANYVLNGVLANGQAVTTAPNENLSWEKTKMVNIGIDGQLFNNKLNFTAEFFNSNTEDLLLNVPTPSHTGYDYSLQNLGKVRNTGFEFTLGGTINIGELKWKPSANIYTVKNEVVELGLGQERILNTVHVTELGKPIGSFYGYNVLGVYQNQDDLNNSPRLPTSQVGSYKYEDVNKDGKISDADRKILGDFFPDYTFGISNKFKYKNFDLNVVVEGKQGYDIFYGLGFFHFNQEGWSNMSSELVDNSFSPNNTNATYAKPLASPTDKNYEFSNLMIQDGSFVRIKNISLGYALPKAALKSIGMKYIRLYFTAQNPFTFTKYIGYNPEVSSKNKSWNKNTLTRGVDYGAYPLAKSFVLGIQAKF